MGRFGVTHTGEGCNRMRGANILFNLVTFVFVALTLVVIVYAVAIAGDMAEPPFLLPPTDVPTPTLIPDLGEELPTPFLPTFTPSHTPEPTETPEPTMTPTPEPTEPLEAPPFTEPLPEMETPAPTEPPPEDTPESGEAGPPTETEDDAVGSAALAALPSFTPLATRDMLATNHTATPTITLTPGPRPTNTVTPTPQGPVPPTLAPYPFVVQPGTPLLRDSFAEGTTGCEWQGVAGTIVVQRGEAVVGVEVRDRGDASGEQTVLAGTDTDYGPSGWEARLSSAPRAERVTVVLWADDQLVSPPVEVLFPGVCAQNLALINFVQTRTY